jgi:hypothetical protein
VFIDQNNRKAKESFPLGMNENAPVQASESSPNAQQSGGTVENPVENPPPPIKNINLEQQSPQMVQRPKLTEAMVGRFDEGYDSDGQIGPFYDAIVAEGEQIPNEDSLCEVVANATDTATMASSAPSNATPPTAQLLQLPIDVFIHIEQEALNKMLKEDLMEELCIRNLSTKGKKPELKMRLEQGLKDRVHVKHHRHKSKRKNKKDESSVGKGFPSTAKWEPLVPDTKQVSEPQNPTFQFPRAPTVAKGDERVGPSKFNFSKYKFDIPQFTGVKQVPKLHRGRVQMRGGKKVMETIPIKKGFMKHKAMTKHKLSPHSLPSEFINVFFPFKKNIQKGVNGKVCEMLSIELITKWTNIKADMMGAGFAIYPTFEKFTPVEIKRHLGLYLLQGVAPSPQIESKFSSQKRDPIHGNDMVHDAFGGNAVLRHKQFKAFFAVQDPLIATPSREEYPNWKVREMIKWINFISPKVYKPGISLSIDEMTIGFQGKHKDKMRITYKAEGDGFQADALCHDGYTLQVYMRNNPAPKKYLQKKLSPLHARVLGLFECLEEKHHQVGMDNLYNSATFARQCFNHPKKVLTHGVARKGGRGVPKCVVQEEVTAKGAQRKV